MAEELGGGGAGGGGDDNVPREPPPVCTDLVQVLRSNTAHRARILPYLKTRDLLAVMALSRALRRERRLLRLVDALEFSSATTDASAAEVLERFGSVRPPPRHP